MIDRTAELQDIVIVVKRFTRTHDHDVGYPDTQSFHVSLHFQYLQGHFPGNPIVPGVILCEILAQSACILLKDKLEEGQLPVYTGLNNVKFRSPVKPGDTVETRCSIKRAKHPFYFAEGTVSDTLLVTLGGAEIRENNETLQHYVSSMREQVGDIEDREEWTPRDAETQTAEVTETEAEEEAEDNVDKPKRSLFGFMKR